MVQKIHFDRDAMANHYANSRLRIDKAIQEIFFLPENSADREIRLVQINSLLPDRLVDELEPIDYGIDRGTETEHQLLVLDITNKQWNLIKKNKLQLPSGWSIENAIPYPRRKKS